ncbi:hypothetical protein, partial [Pseudomonas syringae group genomosp. 7]|uniref:hypothetical protein n=1 Tax=Pseudomonas syringae group genomosp. 7 TaxID=251699 RepID=UPI00376F64A3
DLNISRTVLWVWGAIWLTVSLICVVQLNVALDEQTSLLLIAASHSAAHWPLLALRWRWTDHAALCCTHTPLSPVL